MRRAYLSALGLLLVVLGTGCSGTSTRMTSPTGSDAAGVVFPAGGTEAGWQTVVNHDLGFSLRYPSTWEAPPSEGTVLKAKGGAPGKRPEVSVMTSTNTEVDPSWRKAHLANGSLVSYSVDERYLHLYARHAGRLVILSAEIDAHDAMQILSTYKSITDE